MPTYFVPGNGRSHDKLKNRNLSVFYRIECSLNELYLSQQLIYMLSPIFTCHGCKYNIFHLADSMSVWNLLREFRIRQVHMAVVLNEYGGTIGVCPYETNPLYSVLLTTE